MDSDGLENISPEMLNEMLDEWIRSQGLEIEKKPEKKIKPYLSICSKDFHDGLLLVVDHNCNYGFIDRTGKEVISCRWADAKDFHEGLSAVRDNNKNWGFIDKTGKEVIPCRWSNAHDFHEGLAAVQDNNEKWGFVDRTGKEVIPCTWKTVEHRLSNISRKGWHLYRTITRSGEPLT